MGVYIANMIMPKNCIECDYSESNGKTYTWCTMMGIHTDGLEQVPNNCPLIELDDEMITKFAEAYLEREAEDGDIHT